MVEEMAENQQTQSTDETQQPASDATQNADVVVNKPSNEYVKELTKEKSTLDPATHSVAMKLLDEEIARAQKGKTKDPKAICDLYRDRPIRASVKVSFPIKDHPRFNFVGKLLGPKGNTLKRLQEETMTKMAILGRGSMRDKAKEDECRSSGDPKFAHLSDDLHVEIFATGPPAEAHARLAYAMVEIRKYLTPDVEDMHEPAAGGPIRGRGRGGFRGGMMGHPPIPPRAAAGANKVMSILDRARMSMEGGFNQGGFEEGPGYGYAPPPYDNGAGGYGEFDYAAGGAPGGRWKGYGGPKGAAGGGSRFPPRPAPYNRPPK